MKIALIGTGYVGLVTGTCLANIGHDIICVDHAEEKVEALNSGKIPIFEPGLAEIVQSAKSSGKLVFTTDLAEAVRSVDLIFIAVGTPQASDGRSAT